MDIHLAPEVSFDILLEDLQAKFRSGARFFKGAQMAVSFSGRPLNRTEEEQILISLPIQPESTLYVS